MNLDFAVPEHPLRPLEPGMEVRAWHDGRPFLYRTDTGTATWDGPDLQGDGSSDHLRIVLQPDEGGPLYSAYQFLLSKHVAVHFLRDEAPLGILDA